MTTDTDHQLAVVRSDSLRALVSQDLRRSGFPTSPTLVDDVLDRVGLAVIGRHRRGSSAIQDPASHLRRLVRDVVDDLGRPDHSGVKRDRHVTAAADPVAGRAGSRTGRQDHDHAALVEPHMFDTMRRHIGRSVAKPWLTAAALAYVTLLAHPSAVPADVVAPPADATADEVRARYALWITGAADLFHEPCPPVIQARRDRCMDDLLALIEDTILRCRLESDLDLG